MRVLPFLLAAGLTCALPAMLAAQESRPGRPYRGLFGTDTSDLGQSLIATGSLGGGYDTSVLADAADAGLGGVAGPSRSSRGGYGLLSGGLNYSLSTEHLGATASGGLTARYYPSLSQGLVRNTFASGGVSYGRELTRRTRFNLGQTVSYQPYSVFSLFPVLRETPFERVVPPEEDFSTIRGSSLTLQTSAGLTRDLSRQSALEFSYGRMQSRYSDDSTHDFLSQSVGARFTRTISRNLGARLGYGYTLAEYDGGTRITGHNIDAGVDYRRELSLSRRTRLAFSTGASAMNYSGITHLGLTGNATLTREIGRTWDASASYVRNVGFVETFTAPFFYDAVNASITGLITRRLSFNAGAGAVFGNVGLGVGGNGFDTKHATAGLGTALNRHLSANLSYSFYQYGFDGTTLLPSGFQPDMSRHSVRVTLGAWLPVFQRTRRSNASR